MKPKIARPRIPAIHCPHCNGRAIVRTSEQITPLYRELRARCDDDGCGHSFVVEMSIVRTIVPSAKPNPIIHLPLSTIARPANDDLPRPANDASPYMAPSASKLASVTPQP